MEPNSEDTHLEVFGGWNNREDSASFFEAAEFPLRCSVPADAAPYNSNTSPAPSNLSARGHPQCLRADVIQIQSDCSAAHPLSERYSRRYALCTSAGYQSSLSVIKKNNKIKRSNKASCRFHSAYVANAQNARTSSG